MNEELSDIIYHVKKQDLKLNPVKMYEAFSEQHKTIYGSNKDFIGTSLYKVRMNNRNNYACDKIWDVIEMSIKYNKILNELEKDYEVEK